MLTDHFKQQPDESIVREFPIGSGIKYIPVKEIKALLSKHFYKWGMSNLRVQYIQSGHDFIVSGSVELNLEFIEFPAKDGLVSTEKFTFIGANTFKVGTEQAEGNNDNYEAILLANALKNAAKNIGNLFGANLNHLDNYLPNYETPPPTAKNPIVNKTIKNILKQKTN